MGLDIRSFKNIKRVSDFDTEEDGIVHFYNANGFVKFKHEGLYKVEEGIYSSRFGYSAFNDFRDTLCRLVHGISIDEFWKLAGNNKIKKSSLLYHFFQHGDNEGDFDTTYCRILAKQFNQAVDEIILKTDDKYFLSKLFEVRLCFEEAAAHQGAVQYS